MPQVTLRLRICGVCCVILSYGRGALKEGLSRVPHRKPPETRYVMITFDIGLLLTLNQRVQGSNPCTPTNDFKDLDE
jgi:hypothetical protein